jgi:hypothetical protein
MPFLMPVERAVCVIDRGIARRKLLIRFPWPLALLMRLAGLLPRRLSRPMICAASKERS